MAVLIVEFIAYVTIMRDTVRAKNEENQVGKHMVNILLLLSWAVVPLPFLACI